METRLKKYTMVIKDLEVTNSLSILYHRLSVRQRGLTPTRSSPRKEAAKRTDGRMAKLVAEVASQADSKRALERELDVALRLVNCQESPRHLHQHQHQHEPLNPALLRPQEPCAAPSPILSSSSSKGPVERAANGRDADTLEGGVTILRDDALQSQVLRMYDQMAALKQDRQFAAVQAVAARTEVAEALEQLRVTTATLEQLRNSYAALKTRLTESVITIEKRDAEIQRLKVLINKGNHEQRRCVAGHFRHEHNTPWSPV